MKKIIFVMAIAALAAGCNSSTNTDNQNTSAPSNFQTYKNSQYGFEFNYPNDFSFTDPTYANLKDKIVQVQIGKEGYPKTNFGDAAFSVSAEYAKDLTSCLKIEAPENGDGFKSTKIINGKTFYVTSSTGAGAGNLYESKVYRTYNGTNLCIELNETVHTSNIGNYDPGTVTEIDKGPIWQRLEGISDSFKLTQNQ